jgi:glycosyltransferase involved in cell wall biosynthesis
MRISACYIVKDEAAVLARSLDSLKDSVDEIIVVDTGSLDDTVEIARLYGAKIFFQPWQGDFSVPRNFALEKATGDWIIFLDADEYFGREAVPKLRKVIEACPDAVALLTQMINLDQKTQKNLVSFFTIRIFRKIFGLRYEGKIHEELRQQGKIIEVVQTISPLDLCIYHTGYSSDQIQAKAARNLALMQTALQQEKEPEKFYMSVAEAYDALGNMAKAVQYARMDIAACRRRPVTYASRSYRILMAYLSENKKNFAERREIVAKAVEAFPELPEFHAEHAECLAYDLAYTEAIQEMRLAVSSFAHYKGMEPMTFSEENCHFARERIKLWERICTQMKKIKISACVIAKNEEKDIAHWLSDAGIYSDEIIFIDTGSTDATLAIAEQAGIRIQHYPWSDDFSAARNYAIEQAHGDWIVFFDADDSVDSPEKVRGLLAEIDICHPKTDALLFVTANIDADANNLEIQRCSNLRAFRNLPELRYKGNVHETLQRQNGKLDVFIDEGRVMVFHTGYSSKRVLGKINRNLALLEADAARNGEGPQHYRYLADCYFALKDYQQTFHYASLAIEHEDEMQFVGNSSDMYHRIIDSIRNLGLAAADALSFVDAAIRKFPLLPDFYAEKGKIYYEIGKVSSAIESFEKAISVFEAHGNSMEGSSFYGELDIVYSRLGKAYLQVGSSEKAAAAIYQALDYNKYCIEALDAYYALKPWENAAAFHEGIASYYVSSSELEYLARWAEKDGAVDIYEYYAERLKAEFGLADNIQRFYALAGHMETKVLYTAVLTEGAQRLQILFGALLQLISAANTAHSDLLARYEHILPDYMQHLLKRYQKSIPSLSPGDWEGYIALLPMVIEDSPVNQLERYLDMVLDFSWGQVYEAAQVLFKAERWAEALRLYQQIPAGDDAITADFWRSAGICFYYTGQAEAAAGAFLRARAEGCTSSDIEAYQQWNRERNRIE